MLLMLLSSMDWQKSQYFHQIWMNIQHSIQTYRQCLPCWATSLCWIFNILFSFPFFCLLEARSEPNIVFSYVQSHSTSLSPSLGNVYESAVWKQQQKKESFPNGPSDPTHVEHLRCSSCLPDHGMKEACVGQWSLGTLVPVSARVDVSVYWMCLQRRAEKCWGGRCGNWKETVKKVLLWRVWCQHST